jgi:hypothetical protein
VETFDKKEENNEERKVIGTQNHEAVSGFGGGVGGRHRVFIQFDLKNCSDKYNSKTVYNCIYIHTNISMFPDSPN